MARRSPRRLTRGLKHRIQLLLGGVQVGGEVHSHQRSLGPSRLPQFPRLWGETSRQRWSTETAVLRFLREAGLLGGVHFELLRAESVFC